MAKCTATATGRHERGSLAERACPVQRMGVDDPSEDVREEVATSAPALSEATLRAMATDDFYVVRASIADRADTPIDLLSELAHDHDRVVVASVAINPRTPMQAVRRALRGDVLDEAMEILSYRLGDAEGRTTARTRMIVRQAALSETRDTRYAAFAWMDDEDLADFASMSEGEDLNALTREFIDHGGSSLGIERHNTAAREYLATERWWTLDSESEAVRLALDVYRN